MQMQLQKHKGVEDAESQEEQLLILLPGGNWDDHQTMYRNWGKPTMVQLRRISAKARAGENALKWIMHQPDAEVQYKLLMQYYLVLGVDRPTVRSWVKVSKSEVKEIVRLHQAGHSVECIALMTNRCRGTVWHVLARDGGFSIYSPEGTVNRMPCNYSDGSRTHRAMTESTRQEVLRLRSTGLGYKRIAKLVNRHPKTVWSIINNRR
jgi:hypothetical protein